jgi:hypothetical protein
MVVALFPGLCHEASAQEEELKAAREFALGAINGYIENVLTAKNIANFNFRSMEEARQADVGLPLKVMYVSLEGLKDYDGRQQFDTLLKDPGTLWFPVTVGGKIRSKIEIGYRNGEWIAGEFGGVRTVREIDAVSHRIDEIGREAGIEDDFDVMLVKIPALFSTFLYLKGEEKQALVPAMVSPQRFGLENGQVYAVRDILDTLKEVAVQIDGKKVM